MAQCWPPAPRVCFTAAGAVPPPLCCRWLMGLAIARDQAKLDCSAEQTATPSPGSLEAPRGALLPGQKRKWEDQMYVRAVQSADVQMASKGSSCGATAACRQPGGSGAGHASRRPMRLLPEPPLPLLPSQATDYTSALVHGPLLLAARRPAAAVIAAAPSPPPAAPASKSPACSTCRRQPPPQCCTRRRRPPRPTEQRPPCRRPAGWCEAVEG